MILNYFHEIEQSINSFEGVVSLNIEKRIINDGFGIIKGQVIFKHGALDFLEVVRITDTGNPLKKKYKYHFRDLDDELVFRYDNVPHHPEIKTFPHHKHSKGKIAESNEPDLIEVLQEIKNLNYLNEF
jgi:hypothetical protein